jgi:hypothetical protein
MTEEIRPARYLKVHDNGVTGDRFVGIRVLRDRSTTVAALQSPGTQPPCSGAGTYSLWRRCRRNQKRFADSDRAHLESTMRVVAPTTARTLQSVFTRAGLPVGALRLPPPRKSIQGGRDCDGSSRRALDSLGTTLSATATRSRGLDVHRTGVGCLEVVL